MATDPITWPAAFAIIGGIAVAAITVAGYLNQAFKRDKPWQNPILEINAALVKLESKLEQAIEKSDGVQSDLYEHEIRTEKYFDRIVERLEKITDLMIDMIRGESSSDSTSNDKKE